MNIIHITELTACPKVACSVWPWFGGGVAGAGGGDGDLGTVLATFFPLPFPLPFGVVIPRVVWVPRVRIGQPAAGVILVPWRVVMVLGCGAGEVAPVKKTSSSRFTSTSRIEDSSSIGSISG